MRSCKWSLTATLAIVCNQTVPNGSWSEDVLISMEAPRSI